MKNIAAAILVSVLLVMLFLETPFFFKKLEAASRIATLMETITGRNGELGLKIRELERENADLRADIFSKSIIREDTIKVFSAYPWGGRGEIMIAAGADRSIKEGDIVTYGKNVLVGRVTRVYESSSAVITIFDPSWEMPVRIGSEETDSLFQGGNEPKLTLIARGARVGEGDMVVAAGKDFPYGLEIGLVGSMSDVPGEVFREAIVKPAFQANQLRDVSIYR